MSSFIEKVIGEIEAKRQWRQSKRRAQALPAGYREAVAALERYLLRVGVGTVTNGDALVTAMEKLVGVFEKAAASGTPIREVVGADPVRFADGLLTKHSGDTWIGKEQGRLVDVIARAEATSVSARS